MRGDCWGTILTAREPPLPPDRLAVKPVMKTPMAINFSAPLGAEVDFGAILRRCVYGLPCESGGLEHGAGYLLVGRPRARVRLFSQNPSNPLNHLAHPQA